MKGDPVATDGTVACSTWPFRYRGRLQLCVIVKASFEVVPSAHARRVDPSPIHVADSTYDGNPARSLERASDKVPFRPRCDVTLRGHAHRLDAARAQGHFVRLGLARGDVLLLDRVLAVASSGGSDDAAQRVALTYENARGGPGTDNPVGSEAAPLFDPASPKLPTGVGPISPFWPSRQRLVGAFDRSSLDQRLPSLSDSTPWEYFQAAPRAQQVDPLLGGERLVLDGVHPTLARIETLLPREGVAACLLRNGPGDGPVEVPKRVVLSCDGLSIDADRLTFDLTWRGCCELAGEESMQKVLVLAASLRPGGEPDWAAIAAGGRAPSRAVSALGAMNAPGDTTHLMAGGDVGVTDDTLPFVGAAPPAAPQTTAATPWSQTPLATPPSAVAGDATLLVAGSSVVEEPTQALTEGELAATRARTLAPFPVGAPMRGAPSALPPWAEASTTAPAPAVVPGDGTLIASPLQEVSPAPPARVGATPAASTEEPAADEAPAPGAPLASALRDLGVGGDELAALLAAVSAPKK